VWIFQNSACQIDRDTCSYLEILCFQQIGSLLSDRNDINLAVPPGPGILFIDTLNGSFYNIGIKCTAKAPVGCNYDQQYTANVGAAGEYAFMIFIPPAADAFQYFMQFEIERPQLKDSILCPPEFGSRHHFHGAGDLPGRFHRIQPYPYFL